MEKYVLDTLKYIETARRFCDEEPTWTRQTKSELESVRDIEEQAEQICLRFKDVRKAEDKSKAFGKYVWKGMTRVTADSKRMELENKLKVILEDTLQGLEKLQVFLDAVETLAVTSLSAFEGEDFLPKGVSATGVRSVISGAREVCPRLIHFKRDAATFLSNVNLSNVEVLIAQLDQYICVTQQLCERLKDVAFPGSIFEWKKSQSSLKFNLKMSQESLKELDDHFSQLSIIRMDETFRLTFLFRKDARRFIDIFGQCRSRMFRFLSKLEDTAGKLDRMKKGSSISTVVGSSVGLAGGVTSIAGLALAPVTAGASLALTIAGICLGVTSGVNSIVTGVTAIAYNSHHGKKANKTFCSFIEDVQTLLDCLAISKGQVAISEGPLVKPQTAVTALKAGKLIARAVPLAKGIDALVDGASAVKLLKTNEVAKTAVSMGLQEARAAQSIPNLAADLPDIGKLAKGTPLALSKSARAGFIALNALFVGVDIVYICKESWSLAKGKKSKSARLIRSRAALWRSELEAWDKINESLSEGIRQFHKNQEIVEQPFCP